MTDVKMPEEKVVRRSIFSTRILLAVTFYNKSHPSLHKEGLCSTQRLSQSFRTAKQTVHLSQHPCRIHMYTHTPSPAAGQLQLLIHRQASAQHEEPPPADFRADLRGSQLQLMTVRGSDQ